jgi:serine phosphatase RsbU (regulator of sigma subunit)
VRARNSAINLPLGIDENSTHDQFSIRLEPGDLVVFNADALTEALDTAGQMLGEAGLLGLARDIEPSKPGDVGP